MSIAQKLLILLGEIEETIDFLSVQLPFKHPDSLFEGFYKGKPLLVSTDSLLWMGDFQQIEHHAVVLSHATAISTSTGISVLSTPQVYVEIPLVKVNSVSISALQLNSSSSSTPPEIPSDPWKKTEPSEKFCR